MSPNISNLRSLSLSWPIDFMVTQDAILHVKMYLYLQKTTLLQYEQ